MCTNIFTSGKKYKEINLHYPHNSLINGPRKMSSFRGYGSTEIRIVLAGGIIGFFIGLPYGGLKGALLGALMGGIGLFASFLLLIFICWAIGNIVIRIKGIKK